jgi:hypothetical protein
LIISKRGVSSGAILDTVEGPNKDWTFAGDPALVVNFGVRCAAIRPGPASFVTHLEVIRTEVSIAEVTLDALEGFNGSPVLTHFIAAISVRRDLDQTRAVETKRIVLAELRSASSRVECQCFSAASDLVKAAQSPTGPEQTIAPIAIVAERDLWNEAVPTRR